MKLIFSFFFILCLGEPVYSLVKRENQAFCYNNQGIVKGHNVDKKLRIASLSKLFSSYYIVSKLGFNYQYQTAFELTSNNQLIIRGNKDPYFLEHGIFYIISTLTKAGISNITEVLVDDNFYFHFMTDQKIFIKKLNYYFNTDLWNRTVTGNSLKLTDQYKQVRKLIKKRLGVDLVKKPSFSVTKVRRLNKSDTRSLNVTKKWVLPSVKMIHYLKILNSYSNNMTTDELIKQLGGIDKMNQFYQAKGYEIEFVTASGLNKGSGKRRKDNYSSCRKVLRVMGELRKKLKLSGYQPADLLPMATEDVGTLSSRFTNWDYKDSFVFKSGTLKIKPTSALAAMHRVKLLNLVVMAQDYSGYPSLKANEINILEYIINKIELKPIHNDYQPKDFLMFQKMIKVSF